MLIEAGETAKPSMAKVALIGGSVPSPTGRFVTGVFRPGPPDEFLGDEPAGILGADETVDLVPVEIRSSRAAAILKVVGHAGGSRVAVATERTDDVFATVGARVEVLLDVV